MINFSIIIPTIGRHTLARTLDSIAAQVLEEGDEVIVVGDTLDGPQPATQTLVEQYGYTYIEHAGECHNWGMAQRNHAMSVARPGNWYLGTDDTDFFLLGVIAKMRALIDPQPGYPHIFAFIAAWGVVWGNVIAEGQIGGHNFIAPLIPGKMGSWGNRYQGDFDYIASTMQHYPAAIVHDLIITDARGGYDGKAIA